METFKKEVIGNIIEIMKNYPMIILTKQNEDVFIFEDNNGNVRLSMQFVNRDNKESVYFSSVGDYGYGIEITKEFNYIGPESHVSDEIIQSIKKQNGRLRGIMEKTIEFMM